MAPPARVSAGCGELGSAKPLRAEDVEADEHLDVRHRAELAGLDASQDLLGRAVEDVVVVLDEMAAGLLGAPDQRLQLLEGRGGRLLHDDVGAGVERSPSPAGSGRSGAW